MERALKLTFGGKTMVPKEAKELADVCTKCAFAFEGRSQRICPHITFLRSDCTMGNQHLCVSIGTNNLTYFEEVDT